MAKKSNHFNGKKFINPTLEQQISPSFSDIYRMIKEGRPQWPKNLENIAVPNLKGALEKGEFAITFVNHATFIIQTFDLTIITDPVWEERVSPISWFGPKRVRKPGVDMDSLQKIDVILISHNHYDHLDKNTLKKLNEKFSPLIIVPLGDRELVESLGFINIREMDWWENIILNKETTITFTPSQHSSARGLFDRDMSLWGSYHMMFHGSKIYFGGDGGYSTHFADVKDKLGAPDVAILGIGAYLPNFFMKAIHTSPAEAVTAHLDLEAKQSIGMHYGTFQMASEAFEQPLKDLKIALQQKKLSDDSFITMNESETRFYHINK